MDYLSTRGGSPVSASQAILRGLAPDGGLYVPAEFPALPVSMETFRSLSYPERAAAVLKAFLTDYTEEELRQAVSQAYGERFDSAEPAPVRDLGEGDYALELFHGPTLAFKDMALQLLPHLVSLAARKNGENREISILVATSGDTGKAALEGFRDVPGTSCTVFYPLEGVSAVQQLQMTTTGGNNTHVIALRGNFDDAQTGVKRLFASPDFIAAMDARGKALSSANSINFGRLVPQVVYYFSAYADLLNRGAIRMGDKVHFAVPTGNFGDILAGCYARRMGLPVGKLICASNRNDVLTDFFRTGVYSVKRPFRKTISPSMDILVSSNLERLLFELADRDPEQVRDWMSALKREGAYAVTPAQLAWLQAHFAAASADDDETRAEIARRWQKGCLMDPHTAVGAKALRQWRAETGETGPAVIVSTASPYKFAADVLTAIAPEETAAAGDAFGCSLRLEALTGVPVPASVKALPTLPVRHKAVCGREDMMEAVLAAFDR